MRILGFLILAQALSPQVSRPQRPPEVLALVDQSRVLPAEFRDDTLLRISGSSLVREASWKQELIEEAFWSGSHAFLPYTQRADGHSDSVSTNAVRANWLESLTLQARAVREMLPLNPEMALRMFGQIQPIILPKLNCSMMFTPDLVYYYQVAGRVFEGSFTAKQRTDGNDVAFLRQLVVSVESPAQVPPTLEMMFAVKIKTDERRELLSLFAAKLQEIFRSDREYGATESALASAVLRQSIRSKEASVLLPALRSYIVRHVSGRRCTDHMPTSGGMAKSAEQFNRLAAKLDPAHSRYKPISAEEAKPAGDDGTYQPDLTGQSAQSQAVREALRWLIHGERVRDGNILPWTLKERSSQDWLRNYDDAAKLVHDLKEADENSSEAFFCVKADALNLLATLAPPGPTRDKAMEEYREFLEDYYPSIQNPNLWFTMFRHMLYTARFSDEPKDKAWTLDALARSSNPIIALYAKLEGRIGPPSEAYPPSHVQAAKR